MKKSSDARGDINRKKILEYIKNKSSRTWIGVRVNEIVEHTHLTRPTVMTHLNVLVAEDKIKKTRRGAYLPTEIFDDNIHGWSYFEDYLNTQHPFFVTNPNILDLEGVANIILNLIKNDSTEPTLTKYIFEYANRIGAYMMYVFIESLRPRRNVNSQDVRSILTEQFLTQAVPLMDLLEQFLLNIPIDTIEKYQRFYELNDSALERVSKSYKDLYPNIYQSIEDGYQRAANILHSNDDKVIENSRKCIHEWKKRYVHKIGDRYFCPKCDAIVASPEDIGGGTANA